MSEIPLEAEYLAKKVHTYGCEECGYHWDEETFHRFEDEKNNESSLSDMLEPQSCPLCGSGYITVYN
jgi:uncharacterized Zn ribbon protein